MKLLAVLYASERNEKVEIVIRTLEAHWITYKLYGQGRWRGFGEKLLMSYEVAKKETDYTHILHIDAFDVIVLGRPDQLLERFLEFDHPWVSCAEVNCWPDAARAGDYPACDSPWRYLNSGAYLAERQYLADCLERWGGARINPAADDQRFLTDRYLQEPGVILLDTGCRLFQSLLGGWHLFDSGPGWLHNRLTGTHPLVLHHNGGADIRQLKDIWGPGP